MVAHLDAVTSLAVDPNGIYLMSGSEYQQFRSIVICSTSDCMYLFVSEMKRKENLILQL